MLNTVNMLGMSFVNSDMGALVKELDSRLKEANNTFLVTVNTEIIMYARENPGYANILKGADLVTPDGIGIIIGSKILGTPIQERLTGFDLMVRLFHLCSERQYSVYFLGAEPDVIKETVQRVEKDYPSLKIAGYHHGYFDEDSSILEDMEAARPDVVFVGLGVPGQEQWIHRCRRKLDKGMFIGVGGSFDVLAGKVKRAPLIWQKLNLEWLYRLIQRPSRWKRMTVLPIFILKVIIARIRGIQRL